MTKHEIFPFEFNGWDQADTETFIFYEVTWKEQWGPFVPHQTHHSVVVSFADGILETYADNAGPVLDKIKFKGFPCS